jgi:KDO2-lipid IV(A) lauroyltransferase
LDLFLQPEKLQAMIIVYRLFSITAYLVSLLPFPLLYVFSDFLSFVLFHVIRYRKEVVFQNLRNSFPEKTDREIRRIARKYYHNLADITLEVIKTRTISKKQLVKRLTFTNIEIVDELYARNRSILVAIGHCGCWEWTGPVWQLFSQHKGFAVVKPLSDKFFEAYLTKLRSRFLIRAELVPFKQTMRTLIKYRNEPTLTILAADQTPHKDEINYWTTFLNQETPFFLGLEKMAIALDFAVLFADIRRVKRGHYELVITKITDEPTKTSQYEIIGQYVHLLEQAIRSRPDNWLWSHRRWKYKREL